METKGKLRDKDISSNINQKNPRNLMSPPLNKEDNQNILEQLIREECKKALEEKSADSINQNFEFVNPSSGVSILINGKRKSNNFVPPPNNKTKKEYLLNLVKIIREIKFF